MAVCGRNRIKCKTLADLPVCDPQKDWNLLKLDPLSMETPEWMGIDHLLVNKTATRGTVLRFVRPELLEDLKASLSEGFRPTEPAELDEFISQDTVRAHGYAGFCKSTHVIKDDGRQLWGVYKWHGTPSEYLAVFNKYNSDKHIQMESNGFELSVEEMTGLIGALKLGSKDYYCDGDGCPRELPVQSQSACGSNYTKGTYFFTSKPERLNNLIEMLGKKKEGDGYQLKVGGLADLRREELIKHLKDILPKPSEQKTPQYVWWLVGTNFLVAAAIVGPQLKELYRWWRGRVKTVDFGAIVKKKIEADSSYTVKGREAEAREAWKMTDADPGIDEFPHLLIDLATGEGKDKLYEEMIILKEKGDPSVPERWRNAAVVDVDPASFQSDTKWRGNVADKVTEIGEKARKGPLVVRMREGDKIFLSGGASSSDSEVVAGLMLAKLEEPGVRENLLLVITTSRGDEMIAKHPDLFRRFNKPGLHIFSVAEVIDALDGPTRKAYEKKRGVKIPREVIGAAARIAESYYRPSRVVVNATTRKEFMLARFDATKNLLSDAAKMAAKRGKGTVVTVSDVIAAAEGRIGKKLDHGQVEARIEKERGVEEAAKARAGTEAAPAKGGAPVCRADEAPGERPAPVDNRTEALRLVIVADRELSTRLPRYDDLPEARKRAIVDCLYKTLLDNGFRQTYVRDGRITAGGLEQLIARVKGYASVAAPEGPVRPERAADADGADKDGRKKDTERDKGRRGEVPGK
ncbi:MAG: hypothetical protein V2A66_10290 [Pseudomonadota bacterium]